MRIVRITRVESGAPRYVLSFLIAASLGLCALPSIVAARPYDSITPADSAFGIPSPLRDGRLDETAFPDARRLHILQRRSAVSRARGERPGATLSGTLIKGPTDTTTWALYPGACVERALGIWAPKTYPVADSLQPTPGFPYSGAYAAGLPDSAIGYQWSDRSDEEILWHVVSSSEPADQRPAIISGQRMLWCGKYDPAWPYHKVGYPNLTSQILYLDTGVHTAPYYLMFDGNISCERDWDSVMFRGGGDGERDPLGNCRDYLLDLDSLGCGDPTPRHPKRLVRFTGDFVGGDFPALGQTESRMEGPLNGHYRIGPIAAEHRAIYILFWSDTFFSTADGLWSQSQGILLDNIDTSDNGAIYTDQAPVGGEDRYGGRVVLGTPANPIISCRTFPGYGNYWSLASSAANPTPALCSPQKSASDLFFRNGDPVTGMGVNRANNLLRTCSVPVPPGTWKMDAWWNAYGGGGCYKPVYYEYFEDGLWRGDWVSYGGGGSEWSFSGNGLLLSAGTDSVRLVFTVDCGENASTSPAFLIDNVGIMFTSGDRPAPAPWFDVIYNPRTTFIDGTIRGTDCGRPPCWPNGPNIDDNWNDEHGYDEIRLSFYSDLRPGIMGINWRTAGRDFAHPRSDYNPAYDVPRMIFRLFDPATLNWSPWDSTEITATSIDIRDPDGPGPAPPETTVVNWPFGIDWPPPDKLAAGASLPGGFTINGIGSYAGLSWLPRGTRMQYYWKAVDINGGVTYQFSYNAWDDLSVRPDDGETPYLPCHTSPGCVGPKAPWVMEWSVLPGVYPPGPPGSLLEGRTNTPILVLDDRYGPVDQALRALGVRADRHPGHELGGRNNDGPFNGLDAWPNYEDYPIIDSLAAWYRMVIVPMYGRGNFESGDPGNNMTARELGLWLKRDTGPDGGDRCLFLDGNNGLSSLLGSNRVSQVDFVQQTLGVASAWEDWFGSTTTPYPNLDDRFSAPISGAGLATPGTYSYPVDGGCPKPPRFDALTRVVDAYTQDALLYPNGQVAGVARMREMDTTADKDRQKTLANGFSLEYVRDPGIPPTSPSYDGSGVSARVQMLYKFLTSCRGPRTSAPSDTGTCWPCPTPGTAVSVMTSDWSGLSAGFQTSKYGPPYPIQAGRMASGILAEDVPGSAPRVNRIDGNYPNPFNPRTTLRFQSASAGQAEIRIFGVGGRLVRTLRTAVKDGRNEIAWDARGSDGRPLASGIYFYTIRFPNTQSLRGPNHLVIVK